METDHFFSEVQNGFDIKFGQVSVFINIKSAYNVTDY